MPAANVDKLKEGLVLGYNVIGCLEVQMQVLSEVFLAVKLLVKLSNHPGNEKQGNKLEKCKESTNIPRCALRGIRSTRLCANSPTPTRLHLLVNSPP